MLGGLGLDAVLGSVGVRVRGGKCARERVGCYVEWRRGATREA